MYTNAEHCNNLLIYRPDGFLDKTLSSSVKSKNIMIFMDFNPQIS